jgi:hypothetical protein
MNGVSSVMHPCHPGSRNAGSGTAANRLATHPSAEEGAIRR